ncbi:hypothetical protein CGCA056_v005721 [Colletotrichum aenigma]|uniref:uncharacterized protein n=1 Tax=Colletotrichum aenigma TaxID=1215731 RepID=UPI0018727BBE|nr:uncharacterized protein CGCA056_v005721 [Colletotrichum aenigma]KAF5523081.1 hypothetical protein CGCA056_v005721 [Colletotrichum aenigma]
MRVGNNLACPNPTTVLDFLDAETQLGRLDKIHDDLWLAGRPVPPRPLYTQRILKRDIYITEDLDMHLVWGDGRIYLKPLPIFMLEPCFWTEALQCCCKTPQYQPPQQSSSEGSCVCERLGQCRKRARGLLFSYTGLVSNKSDHAIALANGLFPASLTWPKWQRMAAHTLSNPDLYNSIDRRFWYGELRLTRLNKIFFYKYTPGKQYKSQWNQYSSFFDDNLGFIVSTFAYVAIILTAMQVGLATELQHNTSFESMSSGFTIFVIIGLVVALSFVMIAFLYLFANNWVHTKNFEKKRFKEFHEYGNFVVRSKGVAAM